MRAARATPAVTTQNMGSRSTCAVVQAPAWAVDESLGRAVAAVTTGSVTGSVTTGSLTTGSAVGEAMPQRARGNTSAHTSTPRTTQLARHPTAPMLAAAARGTSAMRMPPNAMLRPMARPRRRSNQMATVVVAVSVRAPWPRARAPAKPIRRVTKPVTPAMATSTAPNAAPKHEAAQRTPRRSMIRPAAGMEAAPVRVPTR